MTAVSGGIIVVAALISLAIFASFCVNVVTNVLRGR